MKSIGLKILSVIIIGFLVFSSCATLKDKNSTKVPKDKIEKNISEKSGNDAFLELVGNPANYEGGVIVRIDDKTTIKAKVNNALSQRALGSVYVIPKGTHNIKITYKNKLIYNKQIKVSAQKTLKIELP